MKYFIKRFQDKRKHHQSDIALSQIDWHLKKLGFQDLVEMIKYQDLKIRNISSKKDLMKIDPEKLPRIKTPMDDVDTDNITMMSRKFEGEIQLIEPHWEQQVNVSRTDTSIPDEVLAELGDWQTPTLTAVRKHMGHLDLARLWPLAHRWCTDLS